MIHGTVNSVDELIRLSLKKVELLRELRRSLTLCEKFGVDPNDVEKFGHDPALDRRDCFGNIAYYDDISLDLKEPNYVVLKDGTRVDQKEPWDDPQLRIEYKNWRKARLEEWKKQGGGLALRPDVSPAAWKQYMANVPAEKRNGD